jgi:ABC-2 type transport system permease protein
VVVEAIDPPDPEQGQRIILATVSVLLLYLQILLFGTYVAMGVVEEKSSRVVELLLSTLRPLQLLWGKILGIGAVGLLQLTAYGVVGVGASVATGTLTITGTAIGVLAGTLGWFILGFAFFAVLYAAAGSMVSRQEDVNSTSGPLMIVIIAMFFAAFSSIDDPEASWSTTLSWIPPFSAILMPLRIAAGVATPVQIVCTVLLMVAATALLSLVAAKIYQRSILRIGRTVTWKEALGR